MDVWILQDPELIDQSTAEKQIMEIIGFSFEYLLRTVHLSSFVSLLHSSRDRVSQKTTKTHKRVGGSPRRPFHLATGGFRMS